MKTIYLDCSSGISGDMMLQAMVGLTDDPGVVINFIRRIERDIDRFDKKDNGHGHHDDGHTHRSYSEVKEIIESLDISQSALDSAANIYKVIAEAESKVHGDSLEDLHFHEVGRNQAIANVAGVAFCMELIDPDVLICSTVCDGKGTVKCAHGILEVPVPAVKAMLDSHEIAYEQTDMEGERVTPSGLAMLLGLGFSTGDRPSGTPVREFTAMGRRSVGDKGLVAMLFSD